LRILIVSQYFWPEPFIINDLVINLVKDGHEITVLTGKPNYPDGKLYDGYQQDGLQQECFDENVDVFRVPLRPRRSTSSLNLIRNYLSFIWSGLRYFPSLMKGRDVDVILVFAPSPITSVIPAIPLKWRKKAHLAVWVQDLWPESLAATGHVRNHLILALVSVVVKIIYRFTDTLLVQSRAFYAPVAKMASPEKIVYYPNSINLTTVASTPAEALPTDLVQLLDSKFCIVFAGNIGKAQAVETIVEAAKLLKDILDFQLVLVGSGSMSDWAQEQKNAHSLDNLILAGRYPMSLMPRIYERAAGLLVTLKKDQILSYTIPSKIQAYLAAGKPIIAALNGEGARVVEEAQAGLTCMAEDADGLVSCIRRLYEMTVEERQQMGEKGHAYFLEHFEMSRQALYLVDIFTNRLKAVEGEVR
jgi:glycosyltransferase involved in cell wall biosynthesis